jgi:Mn2+/Fe2+ NRAMP family transporter
MNDAACHDPYAISSATIMEPPKTLWAALRKIGPGIILAGSIIGTGELLLTTSLGAAHGFAFLWLILFSCVIKVFVQIELGRNAISSAKPTLAALDDLPGPRLGANWLVWWWFIMLLCTVTQLGGMVGGVGQALNLAFPSVSPALAEVAERAVPGWGAKLTAKAEHPWAVLTAVCAILLLLSGGYKRIERITTFMVASVTLITIVCVTMLPWTGHPITLSDLSEGFRFDFGGMSAATVAAAFATFGITGVGATELYSYPYWCLEKGYARYAGPRADDEAWAERARGWMRVLHLDAWVSMVVFTVATVAFYCMGAAVLHEQGPPPAKHEMMKALSNMYVPAFGSWTMVGFLIGAWAVLFKTLYVASASHSRLSADFLSLIGLVRYREAKNRQRWIRGFCVFYPTLALALYLWFRDPRALVVFGGFAQAATLPIITGAAIYMRYFRTDRRLISSRLMDVCLWLAFLAMTAATVYAIPIFVKDFWPLVEPLVRRVTG